MRKFFLIVFTSLFFQNVLGQNLKIELTNKTGFDIDSLSISSKYIGLLKQDSSITVECNEILMQDGSIMGFPKGYIREKKRQSQEWECGTGAKNVSSGNYSFDIVMIESTSGYQLYYKRKI